MPKLPAINEITDHIGIIQTAFLGDVTLSLIAPHIIKQIYPEVKITFITHPAASHIPRLAEAVDEVLVFDKRNKHKGYEGISILADEIRDLGVGLLFVPHRSLRSALLAKMSNVKYTVSYQNSAMSYLYKITVPYRKNVHEIRRITDLLLPFPGISGKIGDFDDNISLKFNEEDIAVVDELWHKLKIKDGQNIIAMAPGSVWPTKRWPAKYFESLVKIFEAEGVRTLLLGSGTDAEICTQIENKTSAVSLAGITTIPQTINLLTRISLLITNDSAPTHFAWLAGCPAVAIFGPTSPIFGFYPAGKKSAVAELDTLQCKPCLIHGSKKCPIGTHICMKGLFPERVFNIAMDILDKEK